MSQDENQNELDYFTKMIELDYNKIVKSSDFTTLNTQWNKMGDGFEIFTLYKDTTPVVASSGTVLL